MNGRELQPFVQPLSLIWILLDAPQYGMPLTTMRPYKINAIQPYIPLSHGARLD